MLSSTNFATSWIWWCFFSALLISSALATEHENSPPSRGHAGLRKRLARQALDKRSQCVMSSNAEEVLSGDDADLAVLQTATSILSASVEAKIVSAEYAASGEASTSTYISTIYATIYVTSREMETPLAARGEPEVLEQRGTLIRDEFGDVITSLTDLAATYTSSKRALVTPAPQNRNHARGIGPPGGFASIVSGFRGNEAVAAVEAASTTSWTPLTAAAPTTAISSQTIASDTSATTAATTGSTGGGTSTLDLGGGKKAGLGWNDGSGPHGTDFTTASGSQVGWYYTWAEKPLNAIADIEFLPMLHSSGSPALFNAAIPSFASWNVKRLLSVNEPDIGTGGGGADMTVDAVVTMHQQVFGQDSLKDFEVSTPAVSNSGDPAHPGTEDPPKGSDWLAAWITKCKGACKYDFFPIHYYGLDPVAFQTYVTAFKDKFLVGDDANKYIVITEYGCKQYNGGTLQFASQADTTTFHQTMVGWFAKQPWIKGWSNEAAFTIMAKGIAVTDPLDTTPYLDDPNTMMDSTGKINAMGSAWVAMT